MPPSQLLIFTGHVSANCQKIWTKFWGHKSELFQGSGCEFHWHWTSLWARLVPLCPAHLFGTIRYFKMAPTATQTDKILSDDIWWIIWSRIRNFGCIFLIPGCYYTNISPEYTIVLFTSILIHVTIAPVKWPPGTYCILAGIRVALINRSLGNFGMCAYNRMCFPIMLH